MRVHITIFTVLFFFTLNVRGQDVSDTISRYDIHTMPLTILDYTPRYRIGFEYHGPGHMAYILDLGYGNSALNGFTGLGYIGNKYSLFEVRPEVRYYFGDLLKDVHPYLSAELFTILMSDLLYEDYFHLDNSPLVRHFDQARMRKIKSGIHIKAGFKLYATNRLSVDLYGGIGLAVRKIDYQDVVNPVDSEDVYWYEWFLPVYKFQGQKTIFHTSIGIRFGYYWER